jgi:KDO2-lipid IV(A) lauroyltransferase
MRCWSVIPLRWLAQAVARLPQPALLGVGRMLSWMLWPLLRSRRRIAAINIALCFPALDAGAQRRLLRESLDNTLIGLLETLRAWHAPSHLLAGAADIEGLEHLRATLERGQGVLLLCGHFTHVELAIRLLREAMGRPVSVMARAHNSPCLEGWFNTARSSAFGPIVGKKDVRGLLRSLKDGQPVVYAADQNFNYQHAFVPFFGVPAATLTATPDLVRRSGAQLLPFWFRRDADGRYRIRVGPAWPGWPSGDPVRDAAHYMQELETAVRESPGQYLWAHRRFKTRPPGEPPVY